MGEYRVIRFDPVHVCRYCELTREEHAPGAKCLFGSTEYAPGAVMQSGVVVPVNNNDATPKDDKP